MRRVSKSLAIALMILITMLSFVGCDASTTTASIIDDQINEESKSVYPMGECVQPSFEGSITVEIMNVSPERTITLYIINHTAYPTILFDEIVLGKRELTGNWDWWGEHVGEYLLYIYPNMTKEFHIYDAPFGRFIDRNVFRVPLDASEGEFPGQREVFEAPIQYGVYRLMMNASVGVDEYNITQVFEIDVQFQIDDPGIPQDAQGIFMFPIADQSNITIGIINLFDNGVLYFDRFFQLQFYNYGEWQDVQQLDIFTCFRNETLSLYPRQSGFTYNSLSELYDKLVAGTYRAIKIFWHDIGNGDLIQHEIYAQFTLCLPPWTTRREVVGMLDRGIVTKPIPESNDSPAAQWHHIHTQIWIGSLHEFGIEKYTVVLDSDGLHIPFYDIPIGAIVDITYGEAMMGWGNISEVHVVQIVD